MTTLKYWEVVANRILMKRTISSPHLLPTLTVGLFFSSIVTANTTLAQIISDDTLGNESSQVNSLDSNTQQIDGGAIRGSNLFHSFQEFNVNEGQTVNFSNPEGIAHIFSRVTGNNLSEILGTLGVLGNADLFLLNPNGIIFGPNSSLNVNGSFLATSANSIHFADGNKFTTTNIPDKPLLTISTPIGLGFEQPPGTIVNQSNLNGQGLTIGSASTLALVGGDILLEGATITASGGRIELASAAVDDFIGLQKVNNQWKLEYDGLWRGQNIRLTTGFDPNRNQTTFSSILARSANGNIGDIQLYGQNIVIDDAQIALLYFDNTSTTGNLAINALRTIQLRNNQFDENDQFPVTSALGIVALNEIDNTGEILIDTKKLIIEKGGVIQGSSGLNINPFTGEILGLTKGGNININAEELIEVKNGGEIQTNSITFEDSGNINITSPKIIISNQGKITAEAASFTTPITEEIRTSTGEGGTISIVSDSLEIINDGIISSNTVGEGKAGSINISTDNLRLQNRGTITVNSTGTGDAGDINIQAQSLFLDNNSSLSAITEQSDGGNINLQIKDTLTLRNQSKISTSVGGEGNGGNITIDTRFLTAVLEENSDITANAEFGDGGKISIEALEVIGIQFQETETALSDITVSSEFGLDGIVVISNPDTSISRTLIDATPDVIDANNIFTNSYCKINQNSKFVVTGRGGLPLAPEREILPEYTWEDWRVIEQDTSANNPTVSNDKISLRSRSRLRLFKTEYLRPSPKNNSHPNKINPIQGWLVNQQGQIVLTANPIMVTPHSATTQTPGCS